MKKKLILLGIIFITNAAYSQVGIDTETPKATLDVMAKSSDLTKVDGIIAPRLTGIELKAKDNLYGTDQNATLVYVTKALKTADTSTKTANVTSIGYYYYDATKSIWQKLNIEPWNISQTSNPAYANNQDIYQLGRVGIGQMPENKNNFSLYTSREYDPGNDPVQDAGGIKNVITSKGGNHFGIINYVTDNSTIGAGNTTSGLYRNYGIRSIFNDTSKAPKNAIGAYFGYNYKGSKENGLTDSNIHGLQSDVTVETLGGQLHNSQSYGVISKVTTNADDGNLKMSQARGFHGIVNTQASTGFTNEIKQVWGEVVSSRSVGAGNIKIENLNGVGGVIDTQMSAGGVLDVKNSAGTGYATALNAAVGFEQNNGTANFDRLMGVFVQAIQPVNGTLNIAKSYGIYIQPFRFTGDNEATAFNFYSDGKNTKNYFRGRVGINTEAPQAQLHVVKQAEDLTPAILEGVKEFNGNSEALAAGLPIGALYRTGDILKITH